MNVTFHRRALRGALAMGLAGSAWLALAAAPALAQADAAPVERPVSYSTDQSNRGYDEFSRDCVECHGSELRGGLLGGPPLRGVSFEEKYANGMPAGVLFEVMSATMPPDAPGRYSPDTYADLMAYILERNGFPSGAPLPSNVDELYNLIMEK